MPVTLIKDLEEYLVRCGINEPFEKIYVKNALELVNADMGQIMAIVLISQLNKLQICLSTGKTLLQTLRMKMTKNCY